jgi:hypothetical protein
MTVDYTPWVNSVTQYKAADMNAPLTEICDAINAALALKSDTTHDHDTDYADLDHTHEYTYSDINHDHDSDYSALGHTHEGYAISTHNHDLDYAPLSHSHTVSDITDFPEVGTGDVIGPATNTDNYIPQWNGANSKTLKDGLSITTTIGEEGVDTAIPTEQAVREAIVASSTTQLYVLAGSYGTEDDLVPAEKIIFRHKFCEEVDFLIDFSGSNMWAEVAATAETVFSITKAGVEIGTATFAASGTSATFNMDYAETFNADDILRIVSPVQDATLAGIGWALKGTRN